MKLNDAMPKIEVDAETYRVTADGVHLVSTPEKALNLVQRYFLFWQGALAFGPRAITR